MRTETDVGHYPFYTARSHDSRVTLSAKDFQLLVSTSPYKCVCFFNFSVARNPV